MCHARYAEMANQIRFQHEKVNPECHKLSRKKQAVGNKCQTNPSLLLMLAGLIIFYLLSLVARGAFSSNSFQPTQIRPEWRSDFEQLADEIELASNFEPLRSVPSKQQAAKVKRSTNAVNQASRGEFSAARSKTSQHRPAFSRRDSFRSLISGSSQLSSPPARQQRAVPSSRRPAAPKLANPSQSQQKRETRATLQSDAKCALVLQRTYVRKSGDGDESNTIDHADASAAGSLEPTGRVERVCIRFEDVDQAIAQAKSKRQFQLDDELAAAIQSIEPAPHQIAQLGELNQESSKILAERFDLSPDEILNGLPLIDMSRTEFWKICPLMVKPIKCDASGRFRSFTGHCNNLKHPSWGAAQTPFVRYLAPKHPDGIEKDRVSVLDGSALPPPRLVTSLVHQDHDSPSSDLSLLIMVWGQIIDHDVALAAPPRNEAGLDFNCCKQTRPHPNCKPIEIPDDDPLYGQFNHKCMDFKRSLAGLRPNCALGPRVHINAITSTIDANTVYGSTKSVADQLRTFQGGLLKVQDSFSRMGLKPLMPKQLDRPGLDCLDRPQNVYCFLGGDERVNEQPTLTAIHTIYVREHNRLARKLSQINPHWDDDRVYHETRHLMAATVQHVLVSEYLPMLIGEQMMKTYDLNPQPPGKYWDGYNPEVTPSISQGFTTAAFRQGHTFIQGRVQLFDSRTHNYMDSIQLRQLFKRPFHYYQPGRMDAVLTGIINTPAQSYDQFISEEISGFLFQEAGESVGKDLPAINLARGREQGTPGYTSYREWCGLSKVRNFKDLIPIMSNRTAWQYSRLYKHVDDIDLWSGGVSERRMIGAQIGPTFACIIARQFANIKRGDRFWYEAAGFPSSFTMDQLQEIKKSTQARFICKNSDRMQTIQRHALKLAHPVYNPRVPCDDIPDINLNHWREDPSNVGSFLRSTH